MKVKLCILFGGPSSEYEVSLRSAASVLSHLHTEKYEVFTVGISRKGEWFRFFGSYAQIEDGSWIEDPNNIPCVLSPDTSHHGLLFNDGHVEFIDVVFPVLHGENCEDGAMQGLLTLSGIPFVGCSVAASANTMDKAITKTFAERAGINQAKSIVCFASDFLSDVQTQTARAVETLSLPIFVKPARTGSSVGVSKDKRAEDLEKAVMLARQYDEKIILESGISGQEIECAVLGDAHGEVITSIVGEICPAQEFYTYSAKYDDENSLLYIPARIPQSAAQEVRTAAETIFRAMECFGLSRCDFFFSSDGQVIFNEINSIPGFTSISMYPQLFDASGLPYADLIDRLIELAGKR